MARPKTIRIKKVLTRILPRRRLDRMAKEARPGAAAAQGQRVRPLLDPGAWFRRRPAAQHRRAAPRLPDVTAVRTPSLTVATVVR